MPEPYRPGAGREKVIPTLVAIRDMLTLVSDMLAIRDARTVAIGSQLADIDARLARMERALKVDRPDHRRLVDGGSHVRKRRKHGPTDEVGK